jgi:hypothetical protein
MVEPLYKAPYDSTSSKCMLELMLTCPSPGPPGGIAALQDLTPDTVYGVMHDSFLIFNGGIKSF